MKHALGIDIGSASSKAVILKDGTDVVASAVVQVGTGTPVGWQSQNTYIFHSVRK